MLFGDDSTVKQYENDERIEVHGTGYSKFLIGEDEIENWENYIDTIVESVSANSGRSCICTSSLSLFLNMGDEIAREVAKRVAEIRPLAQDDPRSTSVRFCEPSVCGMDQRRRSDRAWRRWGGGCNSGIS